MIGLVFVKTDDSGAASGLPASGDSAGVQPVIATAAAVTAEQKNFRIMIHPCGWYSGIAIVATTYQEISGITNGSPRSASRPESFVKSRLVLPPA